MSAGVCVCGGVSRDEGRGVKENGVCLENAAPGAQFPSSLACREVRCYNIQRSQRVC